MQNAVYQAESSLQGKWTWRWEGRRGGTGSCSASDEIQVSRKIPADFNETKICPFKKDTDL